MDHVIFRCPPQLLEALQRKAKAAAMSVGEYTRKLAEQDTGISVEVKKGMGGADERTRKRVERARIKGIKERAKAAGTNGK